MSDQEQDKRSITSQQSETQSDHIDKQEQSQLSISNVEENKSPNQSNDDATNTSEDKLSKSIIDNVTNNNQPDLNIQENQNNIIMEDIVDLEKSNIFEPQSKIFVNQPPLLEQVSEHLSELDYSFQRGSRNEVEDQTNQEQPKYYSAQRKNSKTEDSFNELLKAHSQESLEQVDEGEDNLQKNDQDKKKFTSEYDQNKNILLIDESSQMIDENDEQGVDQELQQQQKSDIDENIFRTSLLDQDLTQSVVQTILSPKFNNESSLLISQDNISQRQKTQTDIQIESQTVEEGQSNDLQDSEFVMILNDLIVDISDNNQEDQLCQEVQTQVVLEANSQTFLEYSYSTNLETSQLNSIIQPQSQFQEMDQRQQEYQLFIDQEQNVIDLTELKAQSPMKQMPQILTQSAVQSEVSQSHIPEEESVSQVLNSGVSRKTEFTKSSSFTSSQIPLSQNFSQNIQSNDVSQVPLNYSGTTINNHSFGEQLENLEFNTKSQEGLARLTQSDDSLQLSKSEFREVEKIENEAPVVESIQQIDIQTQKIDELEESKSQNVDNQTNVYELLITELTEKLKSMVMVNKIGFFERDLKIEIQLQKITMTLQKEIQTLKNIIQEQQGQLSKNQILSEKEISMLQAVISKQANEITKMKDTLEKSTNNEYDSLEAFEEELKLELLLKQAEQQKLDTLCQKKSQQDQQDSLDVIQGLYAQQLSDSSKNIEEDYKLQLQQQKKMYQELKKSHEYFMFDFDNYKIYHLKEIEDLTAQLKLQDQEKHHQFLEYQFSEQCLKDERNKAELLDVEVLKKLQNFDIQEMYLNEKLAILTTNLQEQHQNLQALETLKGELNSQLQAQEATQQQLEAKIDTMKLSEIDLREEIATHLYTIKAQIQLLEQQEEYQKSQTLTQEKNSQDLLSDAQQKILQQDEFNQKDKISQQLQQDNEQLFLTQQEMKAQITKITDENKTFLDTIQTQISLIERQGQRKEEQIFQHQIELQKLNDEMTLTKKDNDQNQQNNEQELKIKSDFIQKLGEDNTVLQQQLEEGEIALNVKNIQLIEFKKQEQLQLQIQAQTNEDTKKLHQSLEDLIIIQQNEKSNLENNLQDSVQLVIQSQSQIMALSENVNNQEQDLQMKSVLLQTVSTNNSLLQQQLQDQDMVLNAKIIELEELKQQAQSQLQQQTQANDDSEQQQQSTRDQIKIYQIEKSNLENNLGEQVSQVLQFQSQILDLSKNLNNQEQDLQNKSDLIQTLSTNNSLLQQQLKEQETNLNHKIVELTEFLNEAQLQLQQQSLAYDDSEQLQQSSKDQIKIYQDEKSNLEKNLEDYTQLILQSQSEIQALNEENNITQQEFQNQLDTNKSLNTNNALLQQQIQEQSVLLNDKIRELTESNSQAQLLVQQQAFDNNDIKDREQIYQNQISNLQTKLKDQISLVLECECQIQTLSGVNTHKTQDLQKQEDHNQALNMDNALLRQQLVERDLSFSSKIHELSEMNTEAQSATQQQAVLIRSQQELLSQASLDMIDTKSAMDSQTSLLRQQLSEAEDVQKQLNQTMQELKDSQQLDSSKSELLTTKKLDEFVDKIQFLQLQQQMKQQEIEQLEISLSASNQKLVDQSQLVESMQQSLRDEIANNLNSNKISNLSMLDRDSMILNLQEKIKTTSALALVSNLNAEQERTQYTQQLAQLETRVQDSLNLLQQTVLHNTDLQEKKSEESLQNQGQIIKLEECVQATKLEVQNHLLTIDALKRDLELSDQSLEDVRVNLTIHQESLATSKNQRDQLLTKLDTQMEKHNEMLHVMQNSDAELRGQIVRCEQQLEMQIKDNEDQMQQQLMLLSDRLRKQDGCFEEQLSLQISQLAEDKQLLTQENGRLSGSLEAQKEQISLLNNNLSQSVVAKEALRKQMEKIVTDVENQKINLMAEILQYKSRLQSTKSEMELQLNQAKQQIQVEVEAKQVQLATMQLELQKMQQSVAQAQGDLKQEVVSKKTAMQVKQREYDDLLAENGRIATQMQTRGGQIQGLKQTIEELQLQVQELQGAQQQPQQHTENDTPAQIQKVQPLQEVPSNYSTEVRRTNQSQERPAKRPYQDLSTAGRVGVVQDSSQSKATSKKSQALDQLYLECLERSRSILERNLDMVGKQSPLRGEAAAQTQQNFKAAVATKRGASREREDSSGRKSRMDQNLQKHHVRQSSLNQVTKVQFQVVPKESKSYKGDLLNGVRHGRGKYSYDNGDCYEGEWYKDQRYGYGTLRDKEGDIYLGYWQFDQMNGCGHLRNVDIESINTPIDYHNLDEIGNKWVSYQGEFQNGQFHGYGTLTLSNGERFHGSFLSGRAQGTGTYYRHNGEIIPGQWKNNVHMDKKYK